MITGYDELYSKTEQDLDKLDLNEGELQMYIGEATRNQNGWIEKGARLLNSISKMPVGAVGVGRHAIWCRTRSNKKN